MAARIQFVKRYRMERPMAAALPDKSSSPDVLLQPWSDRLLERHAAVLYRCFADDADGILFPCLRTPAGCLDLMRAIRRHPGFCPAGTWLAVDAGGDVGTIQGLLAVHRFASVQNLGVLPARRNAGIGAALLTAALAGFRRAGATRACLEVTAANRPAADLYRKFGFRSLRAVYAAVAKSAAPVRV